MSTRSRIGYYDYDTGCVKSVYCHFDGYVEGVGAVLEENYPTLEDAKAIVSLGGISSLGESLEYRDEDHENGTRDYHRWRGEPIEIATDYGLSDYGNSAFDCGEEFAYLFIGGRWMILAEWWKAWREVKEALAQFRGFEEMIEEEL